VKEESDSHHIVGARQPTSPASPAIQPASQATQPNQLTTAGWANSGDSNLLIILVDFE